MRIFGPIVLLFFVSSFANAQDSTSGISFLPLPTIGAQPETGLYFGAVGLMAFKLNEKNKTRLSNVDFEINYSLKNQLITESNWQIFTNSNNYLFEGKILYTRFPELFFGVGNDLSLPEGILYSNERMEFNFKVFRRIRHSIFAGIFYRMHAMWNVRKLSGLPDLEDNSRLIALQGSRESGVGVSLRKDSRNNPLNPQAGELLLSADFLVFNSLVGGEHDFNQFSGDARIYFKGLLKDHVWANQLFVESLDGKVPFRMLSLMGGPRVMRAYYLGQFRAKNQLVFQSAYRMPLVWRLGLSVFSSAGWISKNTQAFRIEEIKPAIGLGLRFLADRAENINLRFDYAVGPGTSGFYFSFGEAF